MVLSNQEVAADHNTYTGGKDLPHGIDYNKLSEEQQDIIVRIEDAIGGQYIGKRVCVGTKRQAHIFPIVIGAKPAVVSMHAPKVR